MYKNWPLMAEDFNALLSDLRHSSPNVMRAFGQMAAAATQPGALDPKTKELIAFALSVAARCEPCITYHAKTAARLGASREEVSEAVGMAIYMGAGPAAMYAAEALEAFDQHRAKQAARLSTQEVVD